MAIVAYIGTSVGASENLQVSLRDAAAGKSYAGWKTNLTYSDLEAYVGDSAFGSAVQPITSGNMAEDDALAKIGGTGADKNDLKFYKNPVRAFTATSPYSGWLKADKTMYVTIPLRLRYAKMDSVKVNNVDEEYLQKEIYISDLLIQEDYRNGTHAAPDHNRADLSDAIRVHVHSWRDDDDSEGHAASTVNRLISKNGGTTQTNGKLDVDGDNAIDALKGGQSGAEYGFGNSASYTSEPIIYGEGSQVSYAAKTAKVENQKYYDSLGEQLGTETAYPMVCASEENSPKLDVNSMKYTKAGASSETNKSLGHTIAFDGNAAEEKYLNVDITIWIEGWQVLDDVQTSNPNDKAAMWSAYDYIGSMFDIGFQFAAQAE